MTRTNENWKSGDWNKSYIKTSGLAKIWICSCHSNVKYHGYEVDTRNLPREINNRAPGGSLG